MGESMYSIAIDGPAGAGKSTVAKMLAKRLGYIYIDTGAMYRALTLKAIEKKINVLDPNEMHKLARETKIEIIPGEEQKVYIDGKNVTNIIRKPEVSNLVSHVAQHQGVRETLVNYQRELAKMHSVVMDGRDIGTNVLPNATYKFFLDATIDERAQRRYKELEKKGFDIDIKHLREEIDKRDKIDSTRKLAPLIQAKDAIYIDTTNLTPEKVTDKIYSIIKGEDC